MGLYVRKDQQRTKLQERIASELRDKSKSSLDEDMDKPPVVDGVDDSGFMDGTKSSSGLLGVWLALLAIGVVVVLFLIVRSS